MRRPIRRVVTGLTDDGVSVIVEDGAPPLAIESAGGGPEVTMVWAHDSTPALPAPPGDPTTSLVAAFPAPGCNTVMIVTHPPGSGVTGGDGMDNELAGDVAANEHGLHASNTVDYIVVVSGRVWLELDDGVEVELGQGDVLVQNGTRHGWRNRGDEDAVVAVVLLGADRRS